VASAVHSWLSEWLFMKALLAGIEDAVAADRRVREAVLVDVEE
jgi:hypothetical protein